MKIAMSFSANIEADSPAWRDFTTVADLLPVGGGSAEHALTMAIKHMTSVGAPDLLGDGIPGETTHFDAWCATTDRGSDQSAQRELVTEETHDNVGLWIFGSDCFEHGGQLTCGDMLKIVDLFYEQASESHVKYYGTVTKTVYIWRDHAVQFFLIWAEKFGLDEAVRVQR